MSVEVKGADAIKAKLQRMARMIPNEVARALYEEAGIEAKESQRRTPVDTGELRGSHLVKKPEISGRNITVVIEVGGPAAPYAWHVHENLEAYHKVGRSKYLESTILESKAFMAARIARRIDLNNL